MRLPDALEPEPADLEAARNDMRSAYSTLAIEAEVMYRKACSPGGVSDAETDAFIERAKQLLNVVATAAAVLP